MKLLFKKNKIPYIVIDSCYEDTNYRTFEGIPEDIVFEGYYIVAGILKLDSDVCSLYTNINDFPKKYKDYLNKKFESLTTIFDGNVLRRVK